MEQAQPKLGINKDSPVSAPGGSLLVSNAGGLSSRHIDDFIILYKKHFGIDIDREIAIQKGLGLCRLVDLVDFK